MRIILFLFLVFFIFSCKNNFSENIKISPELLKGSWQFFDNDSIYTEMEISDSVYFYVHAPMKIFRTEPSSFSIDSSVPNLKLLYDDGEVWQNYELTMPDSFTLNMFNENLGQFVCKKIYPQMTISNLNIDTKYAFDSAFLAREKRFR